MGTFNLNNKPKIFTTHHFYHTTILPNLNMEAKFQANKTTPKKP